MSFGGFSRSRLIAPGWRVALVLVGCAGGLGLVGAGVVLGAEEYQAASDELPSKAQLAVGVLRDGSATDAVRLAAAKTLIELGELQPVRHEIADVLAPPLAGAGGGQQMLVAIAQTPDVSPRLLPVVAQRLSGAAPEETAQVIEALGSFRMREAVRLLGRYLVDVPGPVASAAMTALGRLSGRDDLGQDVGAWTAWVKETEGMTDAQWRLRLISALAAKSDRLAVQRHDAVSQLTDSLRKLHLATKAEERPKLLAEMLKDEIPAVRNLGFELVARELSATGHLDGPVGVAALELLRHSDPQVRSSAAVLVRQLAPPDAEQAVADALIAETDPTAASDLLLAAARWPSPATVVPVLNWIQSGTVAGDSATEAAWWLYRAGELGPEESERVLEAIRRVAPENLIPAGVSLLAELGNDEDRARLVPLLTSSSAPLRQAAGEALVWYPEDRGAILAAAAKDPNLFDVASRAVVVDDPTAAGLRALLALPKPSPELARAGILRVAARVPADQLYEVVKEVEDPGLKRAILGDLVSPERVMSEKGEPAKMAAISAAVCELTDLELSDNQPEAALATLDGAPLADGEHAAALRCTALLAMGRVEDAGKAEVGIDAWLRGLELARGAGAGKVLAALEAKFTSLTAEQKARVEAVRAAIKPAAVVGPPSPLPAPR